MNPLRVLLLEDDSFDAEMTLEEMRNGGIDYQVRHIDNHDDYARALEEGGFDIVLSDYSIPGFDGRSALEMARRQCPQVPFIFVTGALGEEMAIETIKSGATDYVLKAHLERLVTSINRALREAAERTERQRAEEALRFLAEASAVLASSLDYHKTLPSLTRLAVPLIADCCIIHLGDGEEPPHQVAVAHRNEKSEAILKGFRPPTGPEAQAQAPCGVAHVLHTRQSELLSSISEEWLNATAPDEADRRALRAMNFTSCITAPLTTQKKVLGAISLLTQEPRRRYESSDLAVAEDLAHRVALAIENALLYQEMQDAVRARDEFLATLSHELRTPLNAMLGWTQLMRAGTLDEATTARALEVVERNTKAQAQLIEDLLEVSRVITGKLQLQVEPLEMSAVVEAAVDTVRPTAEAKSITIEYSKDNAPHLVAGDAHRLQQVLWNLLANAVKFTPRGGQVRVHLHRRESFVQIVVSDNGQGIAPAVLPHIFERFRQADSSNTRHYGGLGLGLAIVRHLVELHGGTVRAHSEGQGTGSTLTVQLPLLAVHGASQDSSSGTGQDTASSSSAAEHTDDRLNGVHVLVVDDQPDARTIIGAVLQRFGAQVTFASSAGEAVQVVERTRPDVIVSDIGMPDEDGYSLMRRVRSLDPDQGGATPALALTAFARQEDKRRAFECGFGEHAVKPIQPSVLVATVARLAGKDIAH